MPATSPKTVVIAKRHFELWRDQVEQRMRDVPPEPIASHYVVIDSRRYPPKQVVSAVTGVDRADFTSHHARRILTGLGFPAGRRQPHPELIERKEGGGDEVRVRRGMGASVPSPRSAGSSMRPSADELEPFIGEWVATKGPEVLVAAKDPRTVVSWLAEHRQQAESMFRVPQDEYQASGIAPL
jgi:hypothetical protein